MAADAWDSGRAYERYVGRWSRPVAAEFLRWLARPRGLAWADIGCGTGALASAIVALCDPASVCGVDASPDFVDHARRQVGAPATFETGDAAHLPWASAAFDVTVSGLVLNFVADHDAMVREMARVTRPGGRVAVYVWDYADGMQMLRHFWDAAVAVSPASAHLDEGQRFPICRPGPLHALLERAALESVTVRAIDVPTTFDDLDDYWEPFLGKTGPAPAYLASVSDEVRAEIRARLAARLARRPDEPITLMARAWAAQGVVPASLGAGY